MNSAISILNNHSYVFVSYIWSILWQSSLLIVLVAITALLFRKASPKFKHILWLLVIVRLFLPASFYLPTGIGNWGRPLLRYMNLEFNRTNTEALQGNISNLSSAFYYNLNSTGISATESHSAISESLNVNSILLIMWMVGVAALLGCLIFKLVRFKRLHKDSTTPSQNVFDIMKLYSERLGIRRRIEVRVSERISSPVVGGIFRLVVVIPKSLLEEMSDEELAPVIVHELAHIKRYDWLVNWLQVFSAIIYFFHPLLWFANRQIRIEREKACDDIVLLTMNMKRKNYANSLLKVFDRMSPRYVLNLGFIGIIEPRSNLGKRIKRIMNKKITPTAQLSLVSILVIILFGLCFMSFSAKTDINIVNQEEAENTAKELEIGVDDLDEKLNMLINIRTQDPTSLENFFKLISLTSNVEFSLAEGLEGNIQGRFEEIPLSELLDTVLKPIGCKWERKGEQIVISSDIQMRSYAFEDEEEAARVKAILENNLASKEVINKYRKIVLSKNQLIIKDTADNLALAEQILSFVPDLSARTFNLSPTFPELNLKDPKEREKAEQFAKRVIEVIKTKLYGKSGIKEAEAQGRRLWFDPYMSQLTIIDTEDNLNAVSEFIKSLPQLEQKEISQILFLKHRPAEEIRDVLIEEYKDEEVEIDVIEKENALLLRGSPSLVSEVLDYVITELDKEQRKISLEVTVFRINPEASDVLNKEKILNEKDIEKIMKWEKQQYITIWIQARMTTLNGESATFKLSRQGSAPLLPFTLDKKGTKVVKPLPLDVTAFELTALPVIQENGKILLKDVKVKIYYKEKDEITEVEAIFLVNPGEYALGGAIESFYLLKADIVD